MLSKELIRNEICQRRTELSSEDVKNLSKACTSQLFSLTEYKEAKTIYIYASTKNEVETWDILDDALNNNKVVGMPVTYDEGMMEFFSVFDKSDLKPGRFGILEPPTELLLQEEKPLIIVPGIVFDNRKNRIGMGGGYYDRYITRFPNAYTIGIAYDFQVVDAIETTELDKPVDLLITDQQMIL